MATQTFTRVFYGIRRDRRFLTPAFEWDSNPMDAFMFFDGQSADRFLHTDEHMKGEAGEVVEIMIEVTVKSNPFIPGVS